MVETWIALLATAVVALVIATLVTRRERLRQPTRRTAPSPRLVERECRSPIPDGSLDHCGGATL